MSCRQVLFSDAKPDVTTPQRGYLKSDTLTSFLKKIQIKIQFDPGIEKKKINKSSVIARMAIRKIIALACGR